MSVRFTARVLVIDETDRVLLFFTHWSRRVLPPRWLTVGGGMEPGESAAEGAARELLEETGQRATADELGEPLHHERRPLPAGHEFDEVDSTYFVWRTQRFEPVDTGWMPDEHDDILDARWFSVAELRALPAQDLDPEDAATLLERALAR